MTVKQSHRLPHPKWLSLDHGFALDRQQPDCISYIYDKLGCRIDEMKKKFPQNTNCCEKQNGQPMGISIAPGPLTETAQQDEACCGAPAGPPSSPFEKPGFALLDFVEEFVQTPAGPVPRVKTALQWPDHAGTIRARLGINRSQYKIAPGLYCVGSAGFPGTDSGHCKL